MRGKIGESKQNAERRGHAGRDLWSRRPPAGYPHCAANKRLSNRIERHRLNAALKQDSTIS